jgi:hypothetical protein
MGFVLGVTVAGVVEQHRRLALGHSAGIVGRAPVELGSCRVGPRSHGRRTRQEHVRERQVPPRPLDDLLAASHAWTRVLTLGFMGRCGIRTARPVPRASRRGTIRRRSCASPHSLDVVVEVDGGVPDGSADLVVVRRPGHKPHADARQPTTSRYHATAQPLPLNVGSFDRSSLVVAATTRVGAVARAI